MLWACGTLDEDDGTCFCSGGGFFVRSIVGVVADASCEVLQYGLV